MNKIFHKRLSEKLLQGVQLVKLGVLNRLAESYRGMYEKETADLLAAAVVNELFCENPTDPVARDFFKTNKKLIDREMKNLQYDDEVCKIVTQALRIKASVNKEQGQEIADLINNHIEELTKLSIFHCDVYTPTPNDFLQIADTFFRAGNTVS